MKLYTEVLDHAPADLTSPEMVVLLVLAEDANDGTRKGYPGMDKLCRRARMGASGVRRVFGLLAARGLEVRVPLGVDKKGRPVFAARGRQTTYRIPEMAANGATVVSPLPPTEGDTGLAPKAPEAATDVAPKPEEGDTGVSPKTEKGDTDRGERRHGSPLKAPQPCHPSPHIPSVSPQQAGLDPERLIDPLRTIARVLVDQDPTVTEDELRSVHRLIIDKRGPDNVLAYIRGIAAKPPGFTPYLVEVRQSANRQRAEETQKRVNQARLTGPWCEHGEAAEATAGDGQPLCPLCRRGLPERARSDRTTDPRIARIVSQVRAAFGREPTTPELIEITTQAARLVAQGAAA